MRNAPESFLVQRYGVLLTGNNLDDLLVLERCDGDGRVLNGEEDFGRGDVFSRLWSKVSSERRRDD